MSSLKGQQLGFQQQKQTSELPQKPERQKQCHVQLKANCKIMLITKNIVLI